MSTHLEQEETEAIRAIAESEMDSRVNQVALRDFHQPRRLSAGRLGRISKKVAAAFQELSSRLRPLLRQSPRFELAGVSEVNATEVAESLDTHFVMQCFRCEGELGWLVWDSGYAAAAAEAILTGAFEGDVEARRLSGAELCIVGELLSEISTQIVRRFDFELEHLQTVQDRADLADLTPSPDSVEPRLRLHMQFEGVGGKSDLCLYLGGFSPDQETEPEADALPEHLAGVSVNVHAYLGSIDIPLTDLLGIEVGDVIPIGLEEGSPIELYVENRACATAELGRLGKLLAVRVKDLDPRSGDIEQPHDL